MKNALAATLWVLTVVVVGASQAWFARSWWEGALSAGMIVGSAALVVWMMIVTVVLFDGMRRRR